MGTCQGKLASVNEALNVSARGVITNLSNIYIYIFFFTGHVYIMQIRETKTRDWL